MFASELEGDIDLLGFDLDSPLADPTLRKI
jgi:hypothetical protein